MGAFDPISALIGGVLIGLASALLMLLNGRIAGISGILGGALTISARDKVWRLSFIAGLIAAPIIIGSLGIHCPSRKCRQAGCLSWPLASSLVSAPDMAVDAPQATAYAA
jgi:uncharacterized membrane protein YedE/YeeE